MKRNKKIKNTLINLNKNLSEALTKMNRFGNKSLIVVDKQNKYLGIISDGDIRKSLLKRKNIFFKVRDIYKNKTTFFYENSFNLNNIKKKFLQKKFDLIPILNLNNEVSKIYSLKEMNFININKKKKNKSINNTNVIIMSGGKGTRLRPYTNILPKPLIPFKDKTLIEHVLKSFIQHKIKNFIFSINYKSELIKAYFKEKKLPIKIGYLEEKKPLGTAGSLKYLKKNKFKNHFIANCDTIIKTDFEKIYRSHIRYKNDITIICVKITQNIPYGVCAIDNSMQLKSFIEKPKNKFIVNTGLYLLNNKILKIIPSADKIFHMTDLILLAKNKNKKIGVFLIKEKEWKDLGNIQNYNNIS